ncbi:putative nuclease HARBI1 [Schistocerca gregaria]|uniref:putative nuclease HARBI1 n=1 Tax=Schistocerca gregaria TaxID=7010 RepID=UPI00211E9EDF|nr:putative nuclease HARBI1 [Schistocerca gregaria]
MQDFQELSASIYCVVDLEILILTVFRQGEGEKTGRVRGQVPLRTFLAALNVDRRSLRAGKRAPGRSDCGKGKQFEDYGDRKFEERFRLSKETVWWLLNQINDRLEFPTDRNNPVSPINRFLITLRAYATDAFNILIGDNSNIHRTTAQRIISDVSDIIASLSPRFIKFPTSEEVRSVMYGFSQLDRFPGVLGTLDRTRIRIQSPGGHNAELFRNRKSYFCFNCQTISNHNLLIRDIVAQWPGSVHDSTIFLNCARRAQFENGEIPQGHLLGDSGYALLRAYLLTPLLNPQNEAEHRYNRSHIKTRNTVERKYGMWKRRFPILSVGIRCNPQEAMSIIEVMAV